MARTRIPLLAAAAAIAALAAPTTASADETTASCDGLSSALQNATTGDVVILLDDEVCFGHFDLPTGQSITFKGSSEGVATLSGDDEQQILSGHDAAGTIIEDLTFVDGDADSDGPADGDGGAIRLTGDGAVTIRNNDFFGNFADDDGGAISIDADEGPQEQPVPLTRGDASPITLSGNTFGGDGEDDVNEADDEGGAVYIEDFNRPVVVDDGNEFLGNVAGDEGGGLKINGAQDAVLLDNRFEGNISASDGGGAWVMACSSAEVSRNDFIGNAAVNPESQLEGGGLFLSSCRQADNLRTRGGELPQAVQSANLFEGNRVDAPGAVGGGEFIQDLDTVSTSDSFVGNSVEGVFEGAGGGLAYVGFGTTPFNARNLVAAGNSASAEGRLPGGVPAFALGGGLALRGNGSELRVEDSTIEGNSAPFGSGITGVLEFSNPEARQRFARGARGEFAGDLLALDNTIVFGNTGASDSSESDLDGEVAGFLERDVRFSDVCSNNAPHEDGDGAAPNSNLCEAPLLEGVNTDGDVDQTAGSPTRDAGGSERVDSDLTQDYAGDGRILDGRVDIGADEYKPAPVVTPPPVTTTPAPPAGQVQGVQQRSCRSRRAFRIRIRVPKGKKALSATVRVNGKKVRVVRGKRLRAPVRLRGLPKGRFRVRITVRLANGKRITGVRTYHTCIPKLPGDGPPKV